MKAKAIEIPTSRLLLFMLVMFLGILCTLKISFELNGQPIKAVNMETEYLTKISFTYVSNNDAQFLDNFISEGERIQEQRLIKEARELEEAKQRAEEAARIQQEQAAAQAAYEAALAAEEARYQALGVCTSSSSKKTYMDYRAISTSSTQMRIINAQTTIQSDGLLVTEDGFIGVALGSAYGSLGSKFRITTDTGQVFKVIKVDAKSDAHTQNGCQDSSGAMIEFVIDTQKVAATYPSVTFSGSFDSLTKFSGNIVSIESYN